MATKKFPSEMSSRGTVKVTDKLMICNIDTGDTCYTTVAELLTAIATLNRNVGIGTATPQTLLHIYGVNSGLLRLENYTDDNIGIQLKGISGQRWVIGNNTSMGGTGQNFQIYDWANSAVRLNIDSNGNVGIGTTAPSSKLQVVGLNEYADNTTALGAGLTAGAFYRTGDLLKVVH
jgi:hypothetical protein